MGDDRLWQVGMIAELVLDEKLKVWALLPISIVMVLVGVIRHYIMTLISPGAKNSAVVKFTETSYINKGQALLGNGSNISKEAFECRRGYLSQVLAEGKYVAQENAGNGIVNGMGNPFTDPNMSDAMMSMAKGNMANFIPQTLIMWWVNHFFAGFVLMKLPFPLTVRFKEMLQSGIMTPDLDVRWVSSISWYFISVLGINPVYNLLLSNAEGMDIMEMQQQQQQIDPIGGPGQPQPEALMKSLANDITIAQHQSCFDKIEERILKKYKI
ncbi:hypothetical protein Kpol_1018p183 [Vanderwaltozyma polyspora DSM 70294]|uniref:ER membrane protein complex subunit 3 n=1 Tax=Vanderwaltozyma polyspora (strain ATCC 22028 / DSM 70294 / BCRC 21397 / CBS 2163 / NBRC 10782 / NRRL Y-8283 / UCD 57-17) TaxID=436907 RepID=A7TE23_VANPO|nr:uncharacterized protein Kpol_1018p183 [Vanderwaltozyma polyspora DSM 70294]EDO19643.1 hypothetical protein Kpol_1018p183 [Vanderwaltozyma polyspora DSM 70294]